MSRRAHNNHSDELLEAIRYLTWIMERLCWLQAPGKMDFEDYKKNILEGQYNASRI